MAVETYQNILHGRLCVWFSTSLFHFVENIFRKQLDYVRLLVIQWGSGRGGGALEAGKKDRVDGETL